jgi:hypothetical protein
MPWWRYIADTTASLMVFWLSYLLAQPFEGQGDCDLYMLPVAGLLLSFAVCLSRQVHPMVYAVGAPLIILAVGCVAAIQAGAQGVFIAYVIVVAFGYGFATLLGAAISTLLRRFRYPPWVAILPILVFAGIDLIALQRYHAWRQDQSTVAVQRIQEIRRAERDYASAHGSYTCNGPDLPGLAAIPWVPAQAQVKVKDKTSMPGFSIELQCPAPGSPQTFQIRADALWRGGGGYILDSAGNLAKVGGQ